MNKYNTNPIQWYKTKDVNYYYYNKIPKNISVLHMYVEKNHLTLKRSSFYFDCTLLRSIILTPVTCDGSHKKTIV